jgi:DNA-binding MarR family transcriptional regulator
MYMQMQSTAKALRFAFPEPSYMTETVIERDISCQQQKLLLKQVRQAITARTRRFDYLRADLFADPAWDILLQLYCAELTQQQTTVSTLVERTNVPSTTALRWITMLECDQLIDRKIDLAETRRVVLALTSRGLEAMDGYFLEEAKEAVSVTERTAL